jgi:hypothetical protein
MDLGHRPFRPMPPALRAAIAAQLVWLAIAPAQHLLSHASSGLEDDGAQAGRMHCVQASESRDNAPLPGVPEHAACAVCLVLAGNTCLPHASPHVSVHSTGSAKPPLASVALLLGADLFPKLQARGPPLV